MTDHRARNRATFGALAPAYDAVGFLTLAAQAVADWTPTMPGGRVLDVACGTGTVALALAARAGHGGVAGVDLAPEMVAVAQARAQAQEGAGPAPTFLIADAEHLPFSDGEFAAVVCASGLFFMPDMTAALREWRRVLRPGGVLVVSAFGRGLLGELPGLWRARLGTRGLNPGAPPLGRIGTLEALQALLEGAGGLGRVQGEALTLTHTLSSPQARWDEIEAGLEGWPLRTLGADERASLRAEHLQDLAPLFSGVEGPLSVPLPLLLARAEREG